MTPLTNTKIVDASVDISFIDLNTNMANNDTDKNVKISTISRNIKQRKSIFLVV